MKSKDDPSSPVVKRGRGRPRKVQPETATYKVAEITSAPSASYPAQRVVIANDPLDKLIGTRPKVTYERYRVPQWLWELLGKPTKKQPKEEHLVNQDDLLGNNNQPASRGGMVVCTIHNGDRTGVGVAICSFSDVFNRLQGYKLANQRANLALRYCAELDGPPGHLLAEVTICPPKQ